MIGKTDGFELKGIDNRSKTLDTHHMGKLRLRQEESQCIGEIGGTTEHGIIVIVMLEKEHLTFWRLRRRHGCFICTLPFSGYFVFVL